MNVSLHEDVVHDGDHLAFVESEGFLRYLRIDVNSQPKIMDIFIDSFFDVM